MSLLKASQCLLISLSRILRIENFVIGPTKILLSLSYTFLRTLNTYTVYFYHIEISILVLFGLQSGKTSSEYFKYKFNNLLANQIATLLKILYLFWIYNTYTHRVVWLRCSHYLFFCIVLKLT